jgi:hypothetical protein
MMTDESYSLWILASVLLLQWKASGNMSHIILKVGLGRTSYSVHEVHLETSATQSKESTAFKTKVEKG